MTNTGDKHTNDIYVYELNRENKALLLSLKDADNKIIDLRVQLMAMENGHIELVLNLESANNEINRLTVQLEDANNEIGRLGMVLRHQVEAKDLISGIDKHNT